MRFTYDATVDAAHLWLVDEIRPGQVSSGEVLGPEVEGASIIADLDVSGHILRLEFLGASKLLPPELLPSNEL